MKPGRHRYERLIRKGDTQVIDCLDCGFWHVDPIPSAEALRQYYAATYFETLGDNRSMTDKFHDPDGFYTLQYEDKLRRLERLLPADLPRRVLDIGSGYGDFLKFMRDRGWAACGLEVSPTAVEVSRSWGLDVHLGSVDELATLSIEPVSVVTLNTVLEHLPDPWAVLQAVRDRLLLPRGIVNIHVPNDFSPLQDVVSRTVLQAHPAHRHYWVGVPDHINYWTSRSLAAFLERLGFRALLLFSTFPLELFPLMGEDYITHPELGRGIHLKRVQFERYLREAGAMELKDALYTALAALGLGREVDAFATLPARGRAVRP